MRGERSRAPRPADPPGTATRRAALRLLDAVLRRGLALDAALPVATAGIDRPDDRALAHAIAAETLRWLPALDALIDSATARPLPDDAKARFALRIALVQALVLETPPHAAISTALPLVEGGPRRLVHGVFGALMRGDAKLAEAALPEAVAARWEAAWGAQMVWGAAAVFAAAPPLDLSLRDAAATAEWEARLGGTTFAPGHVRVARGGNVRELAGYDQGAWWVQDVAASIPARLIGSGTGVALDLCAAPGGKTMQLATTGWQTVAVDVSESRLARLSENLQRTGLDATITVADVLQWAPREPADAVLLDAPCSATGIFRRHPDVLHRVRPHLIAEMGELQAALLARAADWVRPGGRLVYATCSLEPEEGEEQLARFMAARHDFAIEPALPDELPNGIAPHAHGWVRTLPSMLGEQGGCDGFFVARLLRTR